MISVLIDTYNHEAFIRTAVDSVLAQSRFAGRSDWEVVVVDDESSDATPAILAEYGDRIRVVRKTNGGQGTAFNEGLKHCTGDVVLFLDGDDWWHQDKVATVMAEFEAHPEIVAVGHGIVVTDGKSEELQGPRERTAIDLRSDAGIQPFHSHMAFMGTSRLAARRSALDKIGPAPDPLTYEADEYFFTLLPALGPVHVLPQHLTYYRLHGANLYQVGAVSVLSAEGNAKARKRGTIFRCLVETLGPRLVEFGIPEARVHAILEPADIAATRLELMTGSGGGRLRTLAVERRQNAWLKARGVATRGLAQTAMTAAALLLPPPYFYALRDRYAGLKKGNA